MAKMIWVKGDILAAYSQPEHEKTIGSREGLLQRREISVVLHEVTNQG